VTRFSSRAHRILSLPQTTATISVFVVRPIRSLLFSHRVRPASLNRPRHSPEERILAQEEKHYSVAYGRTNHFRSAGEQIL
jgi:hypothetical protein